jgi:hypothetical protein
MRSRLMGWRRQAASGQANFELALSVPLLLLLTFGCIQMGVLFQTYMSVMSSTRDLGRYLSLTTNVTDSSADAMIRGRLPSNLQSARLTTSISPACTMLVSGQCAGRSPGTQLQVTLTYNASHKIFLPSPLRIGTLQINWPGSTLSYTMWLAVEPHG